MTNYDTILQDAARTTQQTQHATRAGSHRGSPSARRGVPKVVTDVLASPGEPIEESVRQEMEAKLGADFSDVRVHKGPKATAAANSVHARAFTYGKHIVFNRGEYRPETLAGKKLLAHELVHVLQQTEGALCQEAGLGGKKAVSHRRTGTLGHRQKTFGIRLLNRSAEWEAQQIADQVVEKTNIDCSSSDAHPPGDVAAAENTVRAVENGVSVGTERFEVSIQVGRSIQRKLPKEIDTALNKWDISEIPRDNANPKNKNKGLHEHTDEAYLLLKGELSTNLVTPKKYKQKYNSDTNIDVITISGGKGDKPPRGGVDIRENFKNQLLENKPKELFLDQTPWDKDRNISVDKKWKDIKSGKPAGSNVGDERFIKGPVEKHFCAATRALQPEYNDHVMNLKFATDQQGKAHKSAKRFGRKKMAVYDIDNTTRQVDCPGSIKGWTKSLGDDQFFWYFDLFLLVAKYLRTYTETEMKSLIKENPSNMGGGYNINITSLNELSETESARLLAGMMTTSKLTNSQTMPYWLQVARFDKFIKETLDNAVRLIERQKKSLDKSTVGDFASNVEQKPALLEQTLINMGKEAARAIHEMCLAALQYMRDNKKTLQNVNFKSNALKKEFRYICVEKHALLGEYYTILRGIKESQKEDIEKAKSTLKVLFPVVATPAGAAVSGFGLLAETAAAVGIAMVGETLIPSITNNLNGDTIDPTGIFNDWTSAIVTQSEGIIKNRLKKALDSSKNEQAVDDLVTVMLESVNDYLITWN